MRKWIKKWLFGGEHLVEMEDTRPAYDSLRHQGSIQAFKIGNGYIMRVVSADIIMHNERVPNLHYCKDHQEIADYIIQQAAIQKLGAEQQMELPLVGGAPNTAPYRQKTVRF